MGLEKYIPDLLKKYPTFEFVYCPAPADMPKMIADADIYIGWLNRDVYLQAKKLKWIQSPSTGIDYYLAIPELKSSDVLLTSARGTHSAGLAESVMGMILAFTRGIRQSVINQQKHAWIAREVRSKLIELTGTTMGIIGLGALGRALAERAHAFGMKIIAVDVNPSNKPDYVHELWALDRLNDLLQQSDFVVVTVPRTPETRGMFSTAQFAQMKPTAMLVGISRGGIIDQAALAKALREKTIAAAALDVFEPEPLPADSELWDLDNLLICAHIAGGTQYEAQYVMDIFYDNLDRFVKGNLPLRNQIDKVQGF
jgi:phosphoglycerate dehydrogenase-like enzyme